MSNKSNLPNWARGKVEVMSNLKGATKTILVRVGARLMSLGYVGDPSIETALHELRREVSQLREMVSHWKLKHDVLAINLASFVRGV